MQFNILTLFPDFFKIPFEQGVLGRALKKNLIQCRLIPIRNFSTDKHQSVDDRPYGGGDGMVLAYPPLEKALLSLKERGKVLYLSPQGSVWDHTRAKKYSKEKCLTLVCGRYTGIDSRWVQKYVDEEISIGDYVLSGGEPAALVLIDSISRFMEGVLGHPESAGEDTFEKSFLLKSPQWTKPKEIEGCRIPDVFFSGHHQNIQRARLYLSLLRTKKQRPDLLEKSIFKDKLKLAEEWRKTLTQEEQKACQIDDL